MWITPSSKLEWEVRRKNRAYGTSSKIWVYRSKGRLKNLVREYVSQKLKVTAGVLPELDYNAIGVAFRKDQAIPAATAKRMLKMKEVQEMIEDELKEELKKLGVTSQYVVDIIKRAILVAESAADAGSMIRGAKEFSEMLGMKPSRAQPPALPPIDTEMLERLLQTSHDEVPQLPPPKGAQ
jgi:hypothetical protein